MSMQRGCLSGRVAVITGAGRGLGRAIAIQFAGEGAKVVALDKDEQSVIDTVNQIKAKSGVALFRKLDVTKEDEIKECFKWIVEQFGSIHILVNNAVKFVFGHLKGEGNGSKTFLDRDITQEDWKSIFETNVIGYANTIKHAVKYMKNNDLTEVVYNNHQGKGTNKINAGSRGSIVNIASMSSFIAQPEFVPYNTSKGAVAQLTRCCAMDLAEWKIRVNGICPGSIETPASYAVMEKFGYDIETGRKVFGDANLMKRQSAPEEIGNGAVFLASDKASFMTGAHIVMDGGETI